jgi:PadR family transcriptional regulator, regulatory protein PadR
MFKAHIKLIVLNELSKSNLSGYDLMKNLDQLGQKTSPGYIYPLLNDLEKKRFISLKEEDRKKIYSITKKGKKLLNDLEKNREEMFKKIKKTWSAIADKEEFNEFIKSKKNMHKKQNFIDGDILERFHRTLFGVYKNDDINRRRKIRQIINDAIQYMEKLK